MVKLARKWNMPFKQFLRTVDMDEVYFQLASHLAYPLDDLWEINALTCQSVFASQGHKVDLTNFIPPFGKQHVITNEAAAAAALKAFSG